MATGKRIAIVCPAPPGTQHGNRIRALRYQWIARKLGYRVRIQTELPGNYDVAIVLHAFHGNAAIRDAKSRHPERPVVLAITGTDLYRDGKSAKVKSSLSLCDRIVVSQSTISDDLPKAHQSKSRIIHQSSPTLAIARPASPRANRVIVAGHLRAVKDPFRAAFAVRNLPPESKILVEHFGKPRESNMAQKAKAEMARNARYRWFGEIPRGKLRRRIATSWMMVLSSKMEGGANVLSEAIANGTPVLSSNIAGSRGMLGKDYNGYFKVGETKKLQELLLQCENEPAFYRSLQRQVEKRKKLVDPTRELQAWKQFLSNLIR